jgi:hypothetical protein
LLAFADSLRNLARAGTSCLSVSYPLATALVWLMQAVAGAAFHAAINELASIRAGSRLTAAFHPNATLAWCRLSTITDTHVIWESTGLDNAPRLLQRPADLSANFSQKILNCAMIADG